MKQQIIELKKKLLLVENAIYAIKTISYGGLTGINDYLMSDGAIMTCKPTELPFYGYKLIGKPTDITEGQFSEWVKECDELTFEGHAFEDYNGTSICDTAKESFFSKLQAEGIYFENRMPKPTKEKYGYSRGIWTWDEGKFHYNNELKIYKAFQEKVWNLDNTYVFEIL